ncbi:thioesterase family protein, partial [Blastococcus sp. SYSU DS0828]
IDWRYTAGSPEEPGPADVWTRVRVPLVADRPLTGLARALITADAANGISVELPIDSWWSIPPGMTTHLTREPDGEWVHLACRTQIAADGIGLCHGELSDERGSIGEVAQPLLVQAR